MPYVAGVVAGLPDWWIVPWAILLALIGVLYLAARYLSRWTFRAAGVAMLVFGLVLLSWTDTPQEQADRPCRRADRYLAEGKAGRAEAAYLRLAYPRDPDPPVRFTGDYLDAQEIGDEPCAQEGLQQIRRRQAAPDPECRSADRLRAAGRDEEAEAAYVRLLRGDDATAYDCAHMGLDELELASDASDEATFDDVIVERGENFAKRLTEAFPGVPAAPGPVTWAVLLVVGVCIWRWLEVVNAARELAPVSTTEVAGEKVSGDGPPPGGPSGGSAGSGETAGAPAPTLDGGPLDDEVISATQLRHRLARAGLAVPAPVPGAAPDLSTLVADTPFGDGWIGRVAAFLVGLAFPPRGVRFAATQVTRHAGGGDTHGLAVEVTLLRSGDPVYIDTFWGSSRHEVVDRAAYGVAQYLTARCPRTPKWAHWGDGSGEALYHFQQGVDHLAARALDEAEASFSRAASAAPANSTIKVELAKVAEQREDYPRAIELYLEILDRHHELLIARYRLAAAYALVRCWIGRLQRDPVMWRRLRSALDKTGVALELTTEAKLVDNFLELAGREVDRLEDNFGWVNLVRRSLARETRPAYVRFLRHPARERHAARRALACSTVAVTIRRTTEGSRTEDLAALRAKVNRVAGKAWGSQAHYNAACCYALLMRRPPALPDGGVWEDETRPDAEAAVRQLREAVSDPDKPFPDGGLPWLLDDDPDLANLRPHPVFSDWVESTFNGGWESPPHCRRTTDLRHRIQVVHGVAAAASANGSPGAGVSEQARWEALSDWVCSPRASWARDALHAVFAQPQEVELPDLAAADRRALDAAWLWIATVTVEVCAAWAHPERSGRFDDAATLAVWDSLRAFAGEPQSDTARASLVHALMTGPLYRDTSEPAADPVGQA